MPVEIPELWRQTVAELLRNGRADQVLIRQRARRDWSDLFPDSFDYQLRDALADALEREVTSGTRHEMEEPGETYGFTFHHAGRAIYGKVNLAAPDRIVIVYSAHRPLLGKETV